MSVDLLYTILLLLALVLLALCYLAHRHGCFSGRGWGYLAVFFIALTALGVYADYPSHFFTSHASASLQSQADSYLPLFDNMPSVPVRVVRQPVAKDRSVAYFDPLRKTIFIKQEYLNQNRDITETLQHEMVHAWVQWKGIDWKANRTHGSTFQKKLREIQSRR